MSTRVGIALGSNLGNRLRNLRTARDELIQLAEKEGEVRQAPIYLTAPVDCPPDSPDFFNTVLELSFKGSPEELLKKTQGLEQKLGRAQKANRDVNSPRPVDIDLLYFGEETRSSDELTLPHPRLVDRLFVLLPLAEICPDLTLPGHLATISDYIAHHDGDEPEPALVQAAW